MLVLEPIFEADISPEQCASRAGRNAQQAVTDGEQALFRVNPEFVDVDLTDQLRSIPPAELLLWLVRRSIDRRLLHRSRSGWNAPCTRPTLEFARPARQRSRRLT